MKKPPLMLAHLSKEPFDDPSWLFEIKWDGFRALAAKNGQVTLLSRHHLSFAKRFPLLIQELEKIKGSFVLDGEIVMLDADGKPRFQLLQNPQGTPYYMVFDILYLNGKHLSSLPLIERKKILEKFLHKQSDYILYNDHIETTGIAFYQEVARRGLEGIIAKRKQSAYVGRRSRDWLKIKVPQKVEVVIGGFTAPKGSRKYFGALLVGLYREEKLVYVGRVGSGFTEPELKHLFSKFKKTKNCPFAVKPKIAATWVEPELTCQVTFTEWTNEGKLRHPIYEG